MLRRSRYVLLAILLSATLCHALDLSQPIRCDYGPGCFVQNYVDVDSSSEWHDFTCGQLTYDGHTGTDFRVSWASYLAGVEVLAAAPGTVLSVRDGVEDRDARGREAEVQSYGLGNVVFVGHDDGYVTIYAHLKQGSIQVKEGDVVLRGQALGQVGLSGLTLFPHLHFGVEHNDVVVCPFLGEVGSLTGKCGREPVPLWTLDAQIRMHYIATGLLQAGFAGYKPALPDVLRTPQATRVEPTAPVLVFAVTVFGVQQGDEVQMRILDPAGAVFARATERMEKNQAQRLLFIGRSLGKRPRWAAGVYRGEFRLIRGDTVEVDAVRAVEVR